MSRMQSAVAVALVGSIKTGPSISPSGICDIYRISPVNLTGKAAFTRAHVELPDGSIHRNITVAALNPEDLDTLQAIPMDGNPFKAFCNIQLDHVYNGVKQPRVVLSDELREANRTAEIESGKELGDDVLKKLMAKKGIKVAEAPKAETDPALSGGTNARAPFDPSKAAGAADPVTELDAAIDTPAAKGV